MPQPHGSSRRNQGQTAIESARATDTPARCVSLEALLPPRIELPAAAKLSSSPSTRPRMGPCSGSHVEKRGRGRQIPARVVLSRSAAHAKCSERGTVKRTALRQSLVSLEASNGALSVRTQLAVDRAHVVALSIQCILRAAYGTG